MIALAVFAWATAAAGQPNALSNHTAIYDPSRQSMIVFGGAADAQLRVNDVWRLRLGPDPQWSLVPTSGGPSPRLGHTAVLDPLRDRMIVFGGIDASLQILGDAWTFSLSDSTWTPLMPSGTPPPTRGYHSAIYDPIRDRMVVFGGEHTFFGGYLNDVWSLWLAPSPRWERILPSGPQPFARFGQSTIYDPVRDRMLVFGSNLPTNDLWALSFADTTWSLLGTTGTPPVARSGHSAIYDAVDDQMVVFGGFDNNQYLDDVWSLSLSSVSPAWSQFIGTPRPGVRGYHTAIYDSAYSRMVVFGGANVTDFTWVLSLGSDLRWSPEPPVVDVSPSALSLPTVTVGDTVSVRFSIRNAGFRPLQLAGFEVSAPGLGLSSTEPVGLPWNTAVDETLTLAAAAPGASDDSLVILSNDPVSPRRRVGLHLDVRGLEFSTHVLGDPDSVVPGVSFIVVVTPQPGVAVERGKLFYRVAGNGSPFDSLALTPLATDLIAAIPATAVTERGVDYFVGVENSGYAAHQPSSAPASFFTQKVAAPESLAAVIPRPTGGTDFLDGHPIEVDVQLPDGAVFVTGGLLFRRGGDPEFQEIPLVPTGISGQVAAVIPDTLVGPRGIEYRVLLSTLRSTIFSPPQSAPPATIVTRVPGLREPLAHPGGRYRLLSVPLDFGPDFAGSLDALLADELGPYDPTRWRAFLYDPVAQANVEFAAAEAARFRPEPGRTFWLISRDAHRVSSEPIAGFSTPPGGSYPLTLAPGWNLLGDPFDFPVDWSEVAGDTAFVGDPVAFDPSRGSVGDYSDEPPRVLSPFEGYFVHATQAATLLVPNRAAGAASPAKAARAQDLSGWRARITARTSEAEDAANTIGFAPGSAAGFDALDQLKPPVSPGAWVRVAVVHPEWGVRAGEYRRDLRPSSPGQTWEVEVSSAAHGEVVTLTLAELAPGVEEAAVLDREQGTSMAWPRGASGTRAPLSIRLASFGPRPYRLAVAAGTEDYVATALREGTLSAPSRLLLEPGAPNPFADATRIRFGMPRPSRVTVRVYGLRGERVATLLDGASLEPGYHSIVWDGRTSTGARAASGVYLARLESDGVVITRRMVLVR